MTIIIVSLQNPFNNVIFPLLEDGFQLTNAILSLLKNVMKE